MSPELIATLAVGVALGGIMLTATRSLRAEMIDLRAEVRGLGADVRGLRGDIQDLRVRMARLEGLFEGFIARVGRESPTA